MIQATDFIQAGYRSYDSGIALTCKNADYFFQKCLYNTENEKLFYINVYVYEHHKKDYYSFTPNFPPVSFAPELQVRREGKPTLNVEALSADYNTVQEMEEDMLTIWKNLEGSKYDE